MRKPKRKWRSYDMTLIGANILLLAYIVYLLFSNYSSQKDIRLSAEVRLADQTAKQAASIGYFISERRHDIEQIARSPGVISFFENKALGMSMKYGLRATLIQTEQEFSRLLDTKTIIGQPLFSRLLFCDTDGHILVEDKRIVAGKKIAKNQSVAITETLLKWDSNTDFNGIFISIPVLFKHKNVGTITGWIRIVPLLKQIISCHDLTHRDCIFFDGKQLYSSAAVHQTISITIPKRPYKPQSITQNGTLFALAPIPSTPFDLVHSLPSNEVFGHTNPRQQLIGIGAVIVMLLICLMGYLRYLDRKRIRTAFEESEERLRQSEKMDSIGKLAGGIAHDFNNMLAAILGAAELIEIKLPSEDTGSHEMINLIKGAARRSAELTRNLLTFSRQQKTGSTLMDIHNIINDALAMLKLTLDKQIKLATKLEAETTSLIGDPSQIQNAILNLGINARDAMHEEGTLTISTKNIIFDQVYCSTSSFDLSPGKYIEIEVSDTGSGISKEIQKRIFEPFFTTKGHGNGTGLGLAAVYGSICMHGGAISVYSEPGTGTVFHIYLPMESDEKTTLGSIDDNDLIPHGSGCILVIDDEEIIRTTAKMLLTNLGYKVILAVDGIDGVAQFKKHSDKINAVVLDMIMPKMNGSDTFREIRKIAPGAKVILASGFMRDHSVSDLKKEGVMGFIAKPYQRGELARLLAEII